MVTSGPSVPRKTCVLFFASMTLRVPVVIRRRNKWDASMAHATLRSAFPTRLRRRFWLAKPGRGEPKTVANSTKKAAVVHASRPYANGQQKNRRAQMGRGGLNA